MRLSTHNSAKGFGIKLSVAIIAFLTSIVPVVKIYAQSTANYAFTTAATGSLGADMNSNIVDMSTGTTQLVGPGLDATASPVTAIGFDFFFMGTAFTQFSVQDDGLMQLGATAVATNVYVLTGGTPAAPRLSAFNADMRTGTTTGKIHYKIVGTAPNRTLVVEFTDMQLFYTSTGTAGTSTWQMRLYETTYTIEYVYGTMSASSITSGNRAPGIGFYTGSATNSFASVLYASHTVSVTDPYAANPTVPATGPITNLTSTTNGSRRFYRFIPPAPAAAPTGLTFTAVTGSTTTLNWTDNATTEAGYQIYRSTDGVSYTLINTTAPNVSSYTATGLNFNTTYFWRVLAFNEVGVSTAINGSQTTSAAGFTGGAVAGIVTVGTGGDYDNLTTAFAAINAGGLVNNIDIRLISGYPAAPETYPIISSTAGAAGAFNIRLYPTVSGLSITSADATGTLRLNAAGNLIIDGRLNGTGVPSLTIANTNVGASYAVLFINDAVGNTIRDCIISSANNATTGGTVIFSTGNITGNDNNTLTNCTLSDGSATPFNAIYSAGSSTTIDNSGNSVTNCNVANYFNGAGASNGIFLASNSAAWTITGNRFYQSAPRTPTAAGAHRAIQIVTASGGGYTINNNIIGYATAAGTGVTTYAALSQFIGITVTAATTPVSNIQGNTVSNISVVSTSAGSATAPVFGGIILPGGAFNIGTTTPNIIGAASGTGAISVASSTTGFFVIGIYASSAGTSVISNNIVSSINASGSTATAGCLFTGIWALGTSGNFTINSNVIGSVSTANAILVGTDLVTTATSSFYGIRFEATGAVIVGASGAGNTVQNVALRSSGSATFYGYFNGGGASSVNCQFNILSVVAHGWSTTASTGSFYGFYNISTVSGILTVSNNRFQNLTNLNTTGLIGVLYNSSSTATATVQNNLMDNISRASTGTSGAFYGYYNGSSPTGVQTFSNNTISNIISGLTSGTSSFFGLYNLSSSSSTWNVFNNTVSNVTAGSGISYGLYNGYGTLSCYSNRVSGISTSGTLIGIYMGGSVTTGAIYSDTVNALSSTGASSIVHGLQTLGATPNIYRNRIYDLSATGTGGVVYGISATGGTTATIYNNLVGDLKAPVSSLAAPAPSIAGIFLSGGTTLNIYYNTINLNASSSGVNFGSAAIYSNATPTTITLRNNIFSNTSTPMGAGKTVAYQRVAAALTNYGTASNNNDFYAGAPGSSRLIYFDGTNSDQTLVAFKTRVSTRESLSVTEIPPFSSVDGSNAGFLHINPTAPTQLEGGGAVISAVTDDYDVQIRDASTPDIGADEFAGTTIVTVVINNVGINPPGTLCVATARTITANITVGSGNILSVLLYYSFNGVAQAPVTMTGGNPNAGQTSTWTGVIPAAVPANAIVTWSVQATDPYTTKITSGTSYQDNPLLGITAAASASPASICAGASSTLSVILNSATPASYTTPAVTNPTTDEDLGNITISQGATTILNNTTERNLQVGTIGTATGTAGSYSDFTAFGPYAFTAGQSYNFSASSLQGSFSYPNAIAIYIDYNRNGIFSDAGERAYTSAATTSGAHTETGSFIVPTTAFNGLTRMRVISNEGLITSPTQTVAYGEFEDYLLNISSTNTGGGSTPTASGFVWSDGTTNVGTTNPLTVNPTVTTSYTATVTVSGCTVVSSPVTVTVIPLPESPTGVPSTQCGTATPEVFLVGGADGNYRWYLQETGGVPLAGQVNYILTNYPISTTTTFWVSINDGTCESLRTSVVASVNPPDVVVASSNGPVCANSELVLTASVTTQNQSPANTFTYTWTASPVAGSGLPTSTPGGTGGIGNPADLTITPTLGGTYVYTVSAVDGACNTSSSVTVTVKAQPVIDSIVATPLTVCAGADVTLKGYSKGIGAGPQTSPTYTTPSVTNPQIDEDLGNVTITQGATTILNNTSAGGSLIGTIGTATGTAGSYSNFAAAGPYTLVANQTYSFSLSSITQNATDNYGNSIAVFIDYNRNGIFSDAGETVYNQGATIVGPHTVTGSFTVPASAVAGITRMRVLVNEGTISGPTISPSWGEFEDYRINLLGFVPQNPSATYTWYDGVDEVGTGSTLVVNPTSTTVYTLSVLDLLNNCSSQPAPGVTVNVNPIPAIPATSNSEQCGAVVPTAEVSSNSGEPGAIFNWYSTPSGGTPLQSSASTTYLAPVAVTTTFYVSEVSTFGCESGRESITITVSDPDPITVSATPASFCIGASADISASYVQGFNNFQTYTLSASPAAGSGITGNVSLTPNESGTGSEPFTVTPTQPGTYVYTITAVDPGPNCTSSNTVTVTVNANPSITSAAATPSTVCAGDIVTLQASSSQTLVNGGILGGGATTTSNSPGTTPFYGGYGGAKTQYLFRASELTALGLIAGNISSLGIDLTSAGATLNGFAISMGTTALTALTSNIEVVSTQVYSATFVPVTGITTFNFTTPFIWDGTSNVIVSFCFSNSNTSNTVSNVRGDNPGFVSGNARYADNRTPAEICSYTGNTTPTGWTTGSTSVSFRPKFIFVQNFTSSFTWVWNPGNISAGTTGTATVTPLVTTTYTATATSSTTGCSSTSGPVTVSVNPLPNAPVGINSTQCGLAVPTASVSTGGGGGAGVFNWYATASGGTALQSSSSSTYTTAVSVTTTFYVSETGTNGCQSERTPVTVTITTAPAISTGGSTTAVCLGGNVVLNATSSESNYIYSWTAVPSAGSGITGTLAGSAPGTSSNTITPTFTGAYVYTVTGSETINGCSTTATVNVSVNANPAITSATATPSTICAGGTVTLQASSVPALVNGGVLGAGGTTTTGTAGTTPFYGGYGGAKTQYLFRASELTALGLSAGNISSLGIDLSSAGATLNGFAISMGTTALTALTSNIEVVSTQVYSATFVPVTGINTFNFTTPFSWDGTSNIIVSFCFSNNNTSNTVSNVRGDNPGFVSGNARYADNRTPAEICSYTGNATPTGWTTGSTSVSFRPKFIFAQNLTSNFTWVWNPGSISAGTTGTATVTPTATTSYTATATNPTTGCTSTSAPVTVTVQPIAVAASASPATPVCPGSTITLNANPTGSPAVSVSWSNGTTVVGTTATITVTSATTTTYTVTVTDACGATATSSVTVTVNPKPTVSIAETGPVTICAPATQTLTAVTNAASPSYQWLRNNAIIGGATSSTYTVSALGTASFRVVVTNTATGCFDTSNIVSVTINPQPGGVTVTPATATICAGAAPVLLTASGGILTATGTITGTSPSTTAGSSSPFYRDYEGNRRQYLITAAELTAIGMVAGSQMNSISFNVTALSRTTNINQDNFTIKVAPTILTTLTSAFENAGLAVVYGPVSYNPVLGANAFNFASSFTWNGTSNVVVEICFDNDPSNTCTSSSPVCWSNAATVSVATAATGAVRVYYADNSTGARSICSITTAQSTNTIRPVMIFGYASQLVPTWSPAAGLFSNAAGTTAYTGQASTTVYASPATTTTYTATATSAAGCTNSGTATVSVNPRPTGVISGGGTYCDGQPTTTALSIAVTGTGPWSGTLSDGTPFSGSASPIVVSVTPTATTTYTIATLTGALCTSVSADLSGSATVTVNPLAANPTATVTQPTCTVGTGTITVTAPLGSGTTYSLDGGAYQSGVTFSGVAPGTHTLTAQSSSGCFSPASTTVTVDPQPFTPAAPVVTGIVNVCPYIATGDQLTYTASAAGATSYVWTMPFNVTLVSGQGTPTIVVTISNNAPGFANQANKQIKVRAVSACGTSAQTIFYLLAQYPSTPGTISGPTNVCALVGTPTQATYTIPAVTAAVNYSWIVPANAAITSGQGTTSITVSFLSGYSGGGVIGVTAENGCGPSGTRTLTLSSQPATQPAPISGPVNACEYMAPNGTAATYTTPAAPGVTYTWSASNGAVILTGQGSNSVTVSYPSGYTGGTISVTGTNGCGTGVPRTLNIYRYNPAIPSVIDVIQTHFCGEPNGREYTYTLANMPANATSILWTIPATGATILSGQGTISITVAYANTSISGTVTAQGRSNCGASSVRSVTVRLPACPPPGFAKAGITTPAAKTITAASDLEVRVFPNPSVSDFKLEVRTQQNKGEINVRVLDLQGRLYRNFTVMAWQTVSVGAELKAGAYLVEVRQGNVVKTTKLVKF